MSQQSSEWERPSLIALAKSPALLADWRGRVAAWEAEHAELAEDWNAAFLEADERERKAEACREVKASLEAAEVPVRYVEAITGEVRKTVAVDSVREWMTERLGFLVLCGSVGCGKSVAACLALTRDGGLFTDAIDLARLSSYGPEADRQWAQAVAAKTLLIDDLGIEVLTDSWRSNLDGLLKKRHDRKRRTIITTNLAPSAEDPPGFKQRYGVRVLDRIKESGRFVLCGDKSLRGRP